MNTYSFLNDCFSQLIFVVITFTQQSNADRAMQEKRFIRLMKTRIWCFSMRIDVRAHTHRIYRSRRGCVNGVSASLPARTLTIG